MDKILEGTATIEASIVEESELSKKSPVFYNAHMKLNRNINVAIVNAINKPLEAIDLLAGIFITFLHV